VTTPRQRPLQRWPAIGLHWPIGTVGCFINGACALDALYHHSVVCDNTLVNRLPCRP